MSKSVYYYTPNAKDDAEIEQALQEKAKEHSEEGFWKAYDRLRNEGKVWNHKRMHRVYVALGLPLRRKVKKRLPARIKEPLEVIYFSMYKQYMVIHGHHRLYVAKNLGLQEIPCVFANKRRLDDYICNMISEEQLMTEAIVYGGLSIVLIIVMIWMVIDEKRKLDKSYGKRKSNPWILKKF